MTTKFLLLLLPAIVYGRIKIQIKPSTNENDASVEILGSSANIITDKERKTFRIQDEPLKEAVNSSSGGRPDYAFVHSPTPWGDLHSRYGWKQIQRIAYPNKARILDIKAQPVVVSTQDFINNSSVNITYNGAISHEVEETVSSTWSTGGDLSMGQEISYSIGFGVAAIGGSTSLTYTSSWGEETSKSKTVKVGSTSGVLAELQPGQRVLATLSAMRGSMTVEVEYVAKLDGDVACSYHYQHNGHYFWRHDINAVMKAGGLPQTLVSKEVIKIEFYSKASVRVDDFHTCKTLLNAPVLLM